MPYLPTGAQTYNLGSSIGSNDTSILLSSFLEPISGTPYTMALIGSDIVYGTISPKTTSSEFISFTGITQNANGTATLTGVTRGLSRSSPFTSSSTFKLPHSGQSTFILSNSPQQINEYGVKRNDEDITGYWTVPDPIGLTDIANKQWVLSVVNGGPVSFNQVVVAGTAGESLVAGNLVYLKVSDGRWYKTDADTPATIFDVETGIAQGGGTTGNAISGGVLKIGFDSNQSGGVAGSIAYASNTAGGISTTPGTTSYVVGNYVSATTIYFDPYFYNNRYITTDQVSSAGTDQSQTTQNGTVEVGEANATTKKNKLAQSFIPAKTKIRGVTLYKSADTGTFTGTVTVSLQADTAGSPSGVALATKTLTNTQYRSHLAGETEWIFGTEYMTLTLGTTYWIVIETSTSDNSNHPNLGTNTGGGYTSGSVKFNNTTDGWVAIATIDLYFKTLEGDVSQVVKTNSSGKIPNAFIDQTTSGIEFQMGANSPLFTKTYGVFSPPMIGTSAAVIAGGWTASSADVVFNSSRVDFGGTGADKAYVQGAFMRSASASGILFSETNTIGMDYWGRFATSSIDTMVGFIEDAPGTTITFNQSANSVIAFTSNNGVLYTLVGNSTTSTATAIPGITISDFHNYRIIADLNANSASFYVDGTLVRTETGTFPGNAVAIDTIIGRSATGDTQVTQPILYQTFTN